MIVFSDFLPLSKLFPPQCFAVSPLPDVWNLKHKNERWPRSLRPRCCLKIHLLRESVRNIWKTFFLQMSALSSYTPWTHQLLEAPPQEVNPLKQGALGSKVNPSLYPGLWPRFLPLTRRCSSPLLRCFLWFEQMSRCNDPEWLTATLFIAQWSHTHQCRARRSGSYRNLMKRRAGGTSELC